MKRFNQLKQTILALAMTAAAPGIPNTVHWTAGSCRASPT